MKEHAMKYIEFKENWFIFGNVYPFSETTIQVKKICIVIKQNYVT